MLRRLLPLDTEIKTRSAQITVEWHINNFFNLSKEDKFYLDSPTFHFCDAEWLLRIFPNCHRCFLVTLLKKWSSSKLPVSFITGIKKIDGSVLKTQIHSEIFKEHGDFYFNVHHLSRNDLLASRDIYAPDDTLTVVVTCILESILENILEYTAGRERSTQTEFMDDVEKKSSQQQYTEKFFDSLEFTAKLSEDLKELLESKREKDFIIRVKDREFEVHRSILSARSPVFRRMLEVDMAEKINSCLDIDDCDSDSFEAFLLFLYSGKVGIKSAVNAICMYAIAHKYQVNQLKSACSDYLAKEMSVDSVCDVILLASLYEDEDELLNSATEYFIDKGEEIVKTPKWLTFLAEHTSLGNELFIKMLSRK